MTELDQAALGLTRIFTFVPGIGGMALVVAWCGAAQAPGRHTRLSR